ncbi:MAG: glycosyltransferase family 9 protein [Cytophagaceae bacterium]
MKLTTKIFLDKTVCYPAALILNFVVRLFGKILRIDHSLDKEFKTITICKYKGLGSIVQATPLMKKIKEKYPGCKLVFVSGKENAALLKNIPLIDELILLDSGSVLSFMQNFPRFIFSLWKLRSDVYIDLEIYSDFSSIMACLSLSKNRLGYFLRSSQYRLGMYTHMMFFNLYSPIANTYLQMGRLLNIDDGHVDLYSFDGLNENDQLEGFGLEKDKYIIINPNCSDLRLERRWDKEKFQELIPKINHDFPEYTLVLIGGKNEMGYVKGIEDNVKGLPVINLAGKTTLEELLVIIRHCMLMVTNDSGPMHIAYAMKVKCVSLFGPCSPEQYGLQVNAYNIYKKVYCSPCVHDFVMPPCKGNNQCMKLISVQEVYELCRSLLKGEKVVFSGRSSLIYTAGNMPLGIISRP